MLHSRQHTTDAELRVDLPAATRHEGTREKLVVQRLVGARLPVLAEVGDHSGTHKRLDHGGVDLVEGEPVGDEVAVAGHHGVGVAGEEVDDLAALPSPVLEHEVHGHLVVRERDERLDVVFAQLGEHVFVERQTGLVGLRVIPVREDARPGDRQAQRAVPHLGEQRDVFLVARVEIDAVPLGVPGRTGGLHRGRDGLAGDVHQGDEVGVVLLGTVRAHVAGGHPASARVEAALGLAGSKRSAPEEGVGEPGRHGGGGMGGDVGVAHAVTSWLVATVTSALPRWTGPAGAMVTDA